MLLLQEAKEKNRDSIRWSLAEPTFPDEIESIKSPEEWLLTDN